MACAVAFAVLLAPGACQYTPSIKAVTLAELESAPARPILTPSRAIITNPDLLRPLCRPLGPRLSLLQARSEADLDLLTRAAPDLEIPASHTPGTLVGLICWAGTPVGGEWPIHMESIRIRDGGGLLRATFEGGTFLPDGTARLETDFVHDLQSVLVVDVGDTSFYPGR